MEQNKVLKVAVSITEAIDVIVATLSDEECDLSMINTPGKDGQQCMIVVTTKTSTTQKLRTIMQLLLNGGEIESLGMANIPKRNKGMVQ